MQPDLLNEFTQAFPAAIAMMQKARTAFKVDWTIPAPWIISLALGALANLVGVVWSAAAVITKLEAHERQQFISDRKADGIEIRVGMLESGYAQVKQENADAVKRLDIHRAQIDEIIKFERSEPYHRNSSGRITAVPDNTPNRSGAAY